MSKTYKVIYSIKNSSYITSADLEIREIIEFEEDGVKYEQLKFVHNKEYRKFLLNNKHLIPARLIPSWEYKNGKWIHPLDAVDIALVV